MDFVILDMEECANISLILRRVFLATGRKLIDVYGTKIILRVYNNVFKAIKHPLTSNTCCLIDILDKLIVNNFEVKHLPNPYKAYIA